MNSTSQTEEIVVFVKPECVQCDATFKALDKAEHEYEIVDVLEHPDAQKFLLSEGYLQLPVVIVGRVGRPDEHWSGFRPDRIKEIRNERALYAA